MMRGQFMAHQGPGEPSLGARFHKMFTAIKRAEHSRFYGQVTELDYEWYLRNA